MSFVPESFVKIDRNPIQTKLRLSREEMRREIFAQYDAGRMLIRNMTPPGIGKSHTTVDIIYHHPDDMFLILIPNHDMAVGEGNLESMLEEYGIDYIHVYGKLQKTELGEKYCMRNPGEEYYPGCTLHYELEELSILMNDHENYNWNIENCNATCAYMNKCPYKEQFQEIYKKQVIICVLEHAAMFQDRVLIIDESFEQKMLVTQFIYDTELLTYNIKVENPIADQINGREYQFFTKIETIEPITINNTRSYFLSQFFNNTTNLHAFHKDNGFLVFGRRDNYLPNYRRIVFNCATTPHKIMTNITNTDNYDDWYTFKSSYHKVDSLPNPLIKFAYDWNKNMASNANHMDSIIKIFTTCNIKEEEILLVTKKDFVEYFQRELSICLDETKLACVHYNAGRGFNSFNKPFKVLLMYGRFGFTPLNRKMFNLIGFSDELVDAMQWSEMMQSLHRGRPLLNTTMPIIFMSDKNIIETEYKISPIVISTFFKNVDQDINMPINRLRKELNCTVSQAKSFKHLSSFFHKYILKL